MLEWFIPHVEQWAEYAKTWGPLIVIVFMAVESSFIPFPSEIIMIPAGFLAARGEFPPGGTVWTALALAALCGLIGSLIGAYVNYYLSCWLGRPFLYKYGKYFFLSPEHLDRAEEIFRRHGEAATFVCRLLPGIRQLISIPAGLSRMKLGRFTFFTGLGAGIWSAVLVLIGWYLGKKTTDKSIGDVVREGKHLITDNLAWVLGGLFVFVVVYIIIHKKIMKRRSNEG